MHYDKIINRIVTTRTVSDCEELKEGVEIYFLIVHTYFLWIPVASPDELKGFFAMEPVVADMNLN